MDKREIDGAERIRLERERQKAVEGWTPEHDDEHDAGELAQAGAAYALGRADLFPRSWSLVWWKVPRKEDGAIDRIRELEKAGALMAAEIDRLVRAERRNDSPVSSSSEGFFLHQPTKEELDFEEALEFAEGTRGPKGLDDTTDYFGILARGIRSLRTEIAEARKLQRRFLGMPVKIDPSLAPDEIRIEFSDADIIRIVGIGAPARGEG